MGPPRLFPAVGHRELATGGSVPGGVQERNSEACIGGRFWHRQVRRESVAADYAQHYVQTAKIAPHRTAWNLTVIPCKLLQIVEL